ncbi:FAD-binding oxidoreductase [Phenylobacterium montanum]|uniref:FAD-binding oxidoreductase n=1 Tax=Phenylobacterium montanum TaxID=2823693 RepID=A0A975G3J0_9CAUL|nr:FAD-binding oxidoreductase [Caulobacter sp. S6]QUD90478.1 FAD-binding oxidoreductase [Caulobacter sp. S6]
MTARPSLEKDLAALVGEAGVVARDDFARFEQGIRYGGAGRAAAVVRPASVEQVRAVVRYAYAAGVRLVPQGANTGLVAASTPDESGEQIVLSLERLAGSPVLDPAARTAVVGAGTRLSALNAAAEPHGLSFPIDLGADPTIGGMIATNTGGARLIRYGDVRHNLLGLEAVIADEEASVVGDLRGLRKNNSGLDLKSLLAGSGGALAIVTRACLNLHPLPRQTATALAIPVSHAVLPELVRRLEEQAGEFLTAAEGMSKNALTAALRHAPQLRNPFGGGGPPDYALLVELCSTAGPDSGVDVEQILMGVLGECMEGPDALLSDALVGRGGELWAIRHALPAGVAAEGQVIAFDLAFPRTALPAFRAEMTAELARAWPFLKLCDFGHLGDGGDHFNLVWPKDAPHPYDPAVVLQVRDLVYDRAVHGHGGSFSAEHGLGPYNIDYYRRYAAPADQAAAAGLKRLFDPKGLLGRVAF